MKSTYKHYKIIFKNKDIKETIEKRYNILIIAIIAIMTILLVCLFKIQIINHSFYLNKIELLNMNTIKSKSTPRGRIYDRNGKLLVDNEAVKVIYYKKPSNVTTKMEIETSYKVANILTLNYDLLSTTNLKKFWILNNKELANSKITDEEWTLLEQRKITSDDILNYKLERITLEELNELTSLDKKAAYIYYLMNNGYSYDEKIIKKVDVTDEEYAIIAENVNNLNGFDVRLGWNRVYLYGDTLRTILGNVSTTESGIPYELKDYYLNLGYANNDRVGTSYLEYQYESLLKGEKTIYQVLSDGSLKTISEGRRGYDIVLTIDIDLQQEVENILKEEIIKAKKEPNTKYYDHSFAIITDPNTGEILAFASKQVVLKDGEYKVYDYTPGIITTSVTAGSIVKGASHAVGYANNALQIGERRTDECIKILATPKKCSWTSLGVVDDITSLKYSSNVYQFKTAINVAGGDYKYNQELNIDTNAFSIYRKTFNEYGLGVLTGIDLPNESLGYKGTSLLAGHLLDFSIGQYDTYTPIQIVQYINTIASGYRIAPHLLKAVYNPTKDGLTDLLYSVEPTILNKVSLDSSYMDRIKEGFRQVMVSGTGSDYINSIYKSAGKTGTSESFIDSDSDGVIDKSTTTNTFGAYAPYDNPKVSFVVISPDVYYNEGSSYKTSVNKRISYRISQKYFEIFK